MRRFDKAARVARQALDVAKAIGRADLAGQIEADLRAYEKQQIAPGVRPGQ
jgi:hypothetical protein